MKRLVACLLAWMVVPIVIVAVEAAPAQACSCVVRTEPEAFASADAVFVGRLIGNEAPRRATASREPASVWTFKVREVYKGKVSRKQKVVSSNSSASCGVTFPKHVTFLVFGDTKSSSGRLEPIPADGQFQVNLCGGTRALSDGVLDPDLGEPYPPEGSSSKHR